MTRYKKLFGSCLTLVFTVILLWGCVQFFSAKTGTAKYRDYFETPEDYDVLFMGSSHTVMGILPMQLWEDYEISSYNLGNFGQWIPVDYWVLKAAFEEAKPKLVVVDVFAIYRDDKYSKAHIKYEHEIFDTMPYSNVKLQAIQDLFPDELQTQFLFPFSIYHSRWNEVDETFFTEAASTMQRGADENAAISHKDRVWVKDCEADELIDISCVEECDNVAAEYLQKIIDLCKSNHVQILLVTTPFAATQKEQMRINSVYELARRNNVKFYNAIQDNIINPHTDLWDIGHLNSSGAHKWTYSLGQYIIENYDDISSDVSDEVRLRWNADYKEYWNDRWKTVQEQENLYNYLILMANSQIDICIYVKEDSPAFRDRQFSELLKNLTARKELVKYQAAAETSEDYLLIVDHGSCEVYEISGEETDQTILTEMGEISCTLNENGSRQLQIGDSSEKLLEEPSDNRVMPDIQIIAYDRYSNEIRDMANFVIQENNYMDAERVPQ